MTRGQLILTRHYASNVITRQLRVIDATSIAAYWKACLTVACTAA